MKITMLKTMCGPDGNAFPGTVLDVDKKQADELLSGMFARNYDRERDANAKHILFSFLCL